MSGLDNQWRRNVDELAAALILFAIVGAVYAVRAVWRWF